MRTEPNLGKPLILLIAALCLQSASVLHTQSVTKRPEKSPNTGFVTANGVKLHYLDWGGTGSVLLMLSGFGVSAHDFSDFAPRFTDRFHVIGLTRRGFGDSEKPATGYDIATRVEDIRQFLDALKVEEVSIVGHSMAGDEMTMFATLHSRRVKKLIYLDAAYNRERASDVLLTDPGLPPLWKRLTLEANGSPEAAKIVVKDMPPPEEWATWTACVRAMDAFRPDYAKVEAPALAFYAVPEHYATIPIPKDADEATRRKLDEWWTKEYIPYIRASVEQFRREAPRGQVVEMKDATHYIFRGRTADEVVRKAREFLLQ